MWIFGGEFSSPTQSQFYHYRDLWVFNLKEQTWQKIKSVQLSIYIAKENLWLEQKYTPYESLDDLTP